MVSLALLLGAATAWAQPTFYFDPAQRVVNPNDRTCINLSVDDFTDMLTISFTIVFDSTVMTFDGIANAALPGLTAASFTQPAPGAGRINFNWSAPRLAQNDGETFPDFQPIVQLCFRIVGQYGAATPLVIADEPAPFLTRENSGGRNIRLFKQGGFIAVGVLPLRLSISDGGGLPGTTICVDVKNTTGYDKITKLRSELEFDGNVLEFTGIANVNPLLVGLGGGQFSTPGAGRLVIDYNDPTPGGTTLPNDTRLFQLCFRLKGSCDQSSAVSLSRTPGAQEVRTALNVRPIGLQVRAAQIDLAACVGSVRLRGATVTGATGDARCVSFTVSGFSRIETMIFDIDFDASQLQFVNVRVGAGGPTGFSPANFDVSAAATGKLRVMWTGSTPQSLRNGFQLFELCFKILAPANSISEVVPKVSGAIIEQNGSGTIPLLLDRNGQVVVLTSAPVVLSVGSGEAPRLGEVCVDLTVAGFRNIQTFRHSLNWNPSVLEFVRTELVGMPQPTHVTFNSTTNGRLGFNWWEVRGHDLPDNTVIYRACFRVVGPPGACTNVTVANLPEPVFVEYAATQGYNSGMLSNAGVVCSQDTRSFTVLLPQREGVTLAGTCLPIRVDNYTNLRSWSFSLAFDPGAFTYDSFRAVAFPGLTVNASEAAAGRLGFSMTHATPTSLPDDSVLFEICLSAKPGATGCGYPFTEEIQPLTNAAVVATGNRFVVIPDGELCVTTVSVALQVTGTATPISCDGNADGSITINVTGSAGPFRYTWSDAPTLNSSTRNNLPADTYTVSVIDESGVATPGTVSVTVGSSGPAPVARAGADQTIVCSAGPSATTLNGAASVLPAGATVAWTVVSGGGSISAGGNTLSPTVAGVGVFRLTITSVGGCTSSDEVQLTAPSAPVVTITGAGDISCSTTSRTLLAAVSGNPSDYSFRWSSSDATVAPAAANAASLVVTTAGTYEVLVRHLTSNCSTIERVVIADIRVNLNGRLVSSNSLNCNTPTTELTVTDLSVASGITFSWTSPTGTIVGAADGPTITVSAGGTYELVMMHPASGCSTTLLQNIAADFVMPVVDAGADQALTCVRTSTRLSATLISGGFVSYSWTSPGGQITSNANQKDIDVAAPGWYYVRVFNVSSGCLGVDSVLVTRSASLPTVDAGAGGTLGCAIPTLTLTGSAGPAPQALDLLWTTRGGSITGATSGLTTTAAAPGVYFLTATDPANGCSAVDSTVVTAAMDLPAADAGSPTSITCVNGQVQLNGSGSTGPEYTISWTTVDGALQANTTNQYQATALQPGTYVLKVTNTNSGCERSASVVVRDDRQAPAFSLPSDTLISCSGNALKLLAAAHRSDSSGYSFTWTRDGVTFATTATAVVASPGAYALSVVDNANGCRATGAVAVSQAPQPLAQLSSTETQLICGRDSIALLAGATTRANGSTVSWLNARAQADAADPLLFFARAAGSYRLIVTTADGMCRDTSAAVVVTDMRTRLNVDAGADLELTCLTSEVLAQADAPLNPDVTLRWSVISGGGVVRVPTSLEGGFSESGTYLLTFTDPVSRCTGEDTLVVAGPDRDGLSARLGADFSLDCGGQATLQGAYVAPTNAVVFAWRQLDNLSRTFPSAERIDIAEPGTYELSVSYSPTGCTARDTIIVGQTAAFTLHPPADQQLSCTASSTTLVATIDNPDAARLATSWRAESGSISGPTSGLSVVVSPGEYWVLVRDLDGDCADSARVVVRQERVVPVTAEATADVDFCERMLTLDGNEISGQTALWQQLSGPALALDGLASKQTLADVTAGQYTLVYQLTGITCPTQATDTVRFQVAALALPSGRQDLARLPAATADTSYQLLRPSPDEYLSDLVVKGRAEVQLDSSGRLTVRSWTSDSLVLSYQICSRACPSRCADASYTLVRRRIIKPEGEVLTGIPNAITPNGDGRNDAFIVDELLEHPERYPQPRLEIFNRWGELVYAAQPYNNDWDGRSMSGADVPDGTYYYVLELDVARSVIMKGHLTVIR